MSEVLVCVLGLSRPQGHTFQNGDGIGKSCLCYRFVHPGYDDYVAEHPSLLALHEFESPVINSVHFVYWGASKQSWSTGRAGKERTVNVHVVENTVFYQDVTSKPFNLSSKPDQVDGYTKRAVRHIESPGKISYWTRDAITLPETYRTQRYPSSIGKVKRGYIVVVDVSLGGAWFDSQFQRAKKICQILNKGRQKFVLVATKAECVNPASLEQLQQLKKKFGTDLILTSAECNYNISAAFRTITARVLSERCLQEDIPTFEQAAGNDLANKTSAKRSFRTFTTKWVHSSAERIEEIEKTEQYRGCKRAVGKYETDRMFAHKLLEAKNREMMVGVNDDPERRREFLEDFIEEHLDVMLYKAELMQKIDEYVKDVAESITPHSSPATPRETHQLPSSGAEKRQVCYLEPSPPTCRVTAAAREPSLDAQSDSFDSDDGGVYDEPGDYINLQQFIGDEPHTIPPSQTQSLPPSQTQSFIPSKILSLPRSLSPSVPLPIAIPPLTHTTNGGATNEGEDPGNEADNETEKEDAKTKLKHTRSGSGRKRASTHEWYSLPSTTSVRRVSAEAPAAVNLTQTESETADRRERKPVSSTSIGEVVADGATVVVSTGNRDSPSDDTDRTDDRVGKRVKEADESKQENTGNEPSEENAVNEDHYENIPVQPSLIEPHNDVSHDQSPDQSSAALISGAASSSPLPNPSPERKTLAQIRKKVTEERKRAAELEVNEREARETEAAHRQPAAGEGERAVASLEEEEKASEPLKPAKVKPLPPPKPAIKPNPERRIARSSPEAQAEHRISPAPSRASLPGSVSPDIRAASLRGSGTVSPEVHQISPVQSSASLPSSSTASPSPSHLPPSNQPQLATARHTTLSTATVAASTPSNAHPPPQPSDSEHQIPPPSSSSGEDYVPTDDEGEEVSDDNGQGDCGEAALEQDAQPQSASDNSEDTPPALPTRSKDYFIVKLPSNSSSSTEKGRIVPTEPPVTDSRVQAPHEEVSARERERRSASVESSPPEGRPVSEGSSPTKEKGEGKNSSPKKRKFYDRLKLKKSKKDESGSTKQPSSPKDAPDKKSTKQPSSPKDVPDKKSTKQPSSPKDVPDKRSTKQPSSPKDVPDKRSTKQPSSPKDAPDKKPSNSKIKKSHSNREPARNRSKPNLQRAPSDPAANSESVVSKPTGKPSAAAARERKRRMDTFMDMSRRPLPQEPYRMRDDEIDSHDEDEYDVIDTMRPSRSLPPAFTQGTLPGVPSPVLGRGMVPQGALPGIPSPVLGRGMVPQGVLPGVPSPVLGRGMVPQGALPGVPSPVLGRGMVRQGVLPGIPSPVLGRGVVPQGVLPGVPSPVLGRGMVPQSALPDIPGPVLGRGVVPQGVLPGVPSPVLGRGMVPQSVLPGVPSPVLGRGMVPQGVLPGVPSPVLGRPPCYDDYENDDQFPRMHSLEVQYPLPARSVSQSQNTGPLLQPLPLSHTAGNLSALQRNPADPSPDYDYPDMHRMGMMTLPSRYHSRFRPSLPVVFSPATSLEVGGRRHHSTDGDLDEYVHMSAPQRGQHEDEEDYQNWEAIKLVRPKRSRSLENIYINTGPMADAAHHSLINNATMPLPPRKPEQFVLPPRNLLRQPQLLETLVSQQLHSAALSQQQPRQTLPEQLPPQALPPSQQTLTPLAPVKSPKPPVSPRPVARLRQRRASEEILSSPFNSQLPHHSPTPSPRHSPTPSPRHSPAPPKSKSLPLNAPQFAQSPSQIQPHLEYFPKFSSQPPGPHSQFSSQSPSPHTQFSSQPPGPHTQFSSQPPSSHPQFSSQPSGPHPQFSSSLPPDPHTQFSSQPPGPHPQFSSLPPGPHSYLANQSSVGTSTWSDPSSDYYNMVSTSYFSPPQQQSSPLERRESSGSYLDIVP